MQSVDNLVDLTLSGRDLENDLLASELLVNRLERLELVVNNSRVLVVKDNLLELEATNLVSDTLANNLTGKTRSSRIASWTAVKVLDAGRFWMGLARRLGLGRMVRSATKTT